MKRVITLATLVGLAFTVSSFAQPVESVPPVSEATGVTTTNSSVVESTNVVPVEPSNPEDNYRLTHMDKLSFSIAEDPVKSSESEIVYVNAQYGLVGVRVSRGSADEVLSINVKDKTLGQVKREIKELLDKDYYYDCKVQLSLHDRTRKTGQVLFYGAGARVNFIPLSPGEDKTLFEGVMQAGVSEFANLKKVKLNRVDPSTGKPTTTEYNVEAIKKDRNLDILLQDEDRIEIPEKKIIF
jgi:hypothetical protein